MRYLKHYLKKGHWPKYRLMVTQFYYVPNESFLKCDVCGQYEKRRPVQ